MALEAIQLCPGHEDHQGLLKWLDDGAPGGKLLPAQAHAAIGPRASGEASVGLPSGVGDEADLLVLDALEQHLQEEEESALLVLHARQLWDDFRARCPRVRVVKPETYAAALEYAVAQVQRIPGATQARVARRYGISPAALSSRYTQIREAVELRPGDPRYMGV
jgi:hypothetical protein